MSEEWCDLCDLPRNTCVHGRPPAEPVKAVRKAPTPRTRKPAAPRSSTTSTAAARVTVRQSAKKFTPAASFRPHIVAVLEEHGGSLDVDELMDAVHARMEHVLLERDHDDVPGGDVRWRRTARVERAAMTEDGVLAPGKASGVWRLA